MDQLNRPGTPLKSYAASESTNSYEGAVEHESTNQVFVYTKGVLIAGWKMLMTATTVGQINKLQRDGYVMADAPPVPSIHMNRRRELATGGVAVATGE